MTATQISYWALQETKQHNRRTEGQTDRSLGQKDTELKLTATQLAEAARHNKASEKISATQVKEIGRHNRATERIDRGRLKVEKGKLVVEKGRLRETIRSDKANEGIGKGNLKEKERADRASEALRQKEIDVQKQQIANQYELIKSQIGVNEANELLTLANRDLTNTKNKYYVYEILARGGDVGQIASILGIASEDITEEDKKQFRSYFAPDSKYNPKDYKPSGKMADFLNKLLKKLSTTNWKPIITQ